jgi:hypothetical protein
MRIWPLLCETVSRLVRRGTAARGRATRRDRLRYAGLARHLDPVAPSTPNRAPRSGRQLITPSGMRQRPGMSAARSHSRWAGLAARAPVRLLVAHESPWDRDLQYRRVRVESADPRKNVCPLWTSGPGDLVIVARS